MADLTINELEKLLLKRRNSLDLLEKRRREVAEKLTQIDAEIAALKGGSAPATPVKPVAAPAAKAPVAAPKAPKAATPPAAKAVASPAGKKGGGVAGKTLLDHILEVLADNKKGLPLNAIAEAVLASGYQTSSSNFSNTLYQCLYHAKKKELAYDKVNKLYRIK